MKKLAVAAILGMSLGLSGCVISVDADRDSDYGYQSDWQDKERKNKKHIAKLTPNQNYADVLERMGTADFNEFYSKNNNSYHVLYYRTQRIDGDGVTTKNECTPLVFKNEVLVGWGDSAYTMIDQ